METPPKPQVLKRISGMYFWEMDPVAHLPTGDGGLLLGFLFCKPSNFELKGPHPLQLCVIRSVFLIGMVELLDYCKDSGSNPNQVTIKPQIPGLGSVFFVLFVFSSSVMQKKFPCGFRQGYYSLLTLSSDRPIVRQKGNTGAHIIKASDR